MLKSLHALFNRGVRYSTIIDVGCADGSFFLSLLTRGLIPEALPLNIDANPVYESSLQSIRKAVGGHFRICAVTDHEGEVELTTSEHPYWSSLRPEGDLYWERINKLIAAKMKVPAKTLDSLHAELNLKAPFLLKLDVQGAEQSVLLGASNLLKNTLVVICEADIDDFEVINRILAENEFSLYDVTELHHLSDGALGWFYPVYINRKLDFVRPKAFWQEKDNDKAIRLQIERRKAILDMNEKILNGIRHPQNSPQQSTDLKQRESKIARNQPCPCGSGKRYKHCHGAFGGGQALL